MKGTNGKFLLKGTEPRILRTMRLTDSCWEELDRRAKERGVSRADLIEELASEEKAPHTLGEPLSKKSISVGIDKEKDSTYLSDRLSKAIALLEESTHLKANAGGAIKAKIKEALNLLKD